MDIAMEHAPVPTPLAEKAHPNSYMPSLDGLRGLACMIVIVSHINGTLNLSFINYNFLTGSTGVLMFFALSGFLMGSLYMHKSFTVGGVGRYLVARFSRIVPAYYLAITFCLIVALFVPGFKYAMDPVMAARSYAFLGSHQVFWSIPPEIQFYLFFLLVWVSAEGIKKGKYVMAGITLLLTLAFVATREMWGGILLPSKLHIFLAGCLAAVALHHPMVSAIVRTLRFQIFIVVATTIYFQMFIVKENLYSDIPLAILMGLTVMSLSHSTIATKILEFEFMRVVGAASFSIYLFHDPLLNLLEIYLFGEKAGPGPFMVNILICSLVSIAIPTAFHYLAERPLNKIGKARGMEYWQMAEEKLFPKVRPAQSS